MSSKQLSIVLGIIVVVLLAVVGYMALRNNSQNDTLSQQNTTPNSNLANNNANTAQPLNNTNTQNPPANTTPPANTGTTQPKSFAYTNADYGFKLTLNQNWEGYKVFKGSNPREVYYQFCVKTADSRYSSDPVVSKGYACPFVISVISKASWEAMDSTDQQRLADGVAGVKNGTRFIFSPWQDPPSDLMNIDFGWESIKKSFSI